MKSVYIETERLIIRDMTVKDMPQMQAWAPHDNPLSPTWNTRWRSRAAMRNWIERYERDKTRSIYAIMLHGGQVIGRLSLRHIVPQQRAVLGIALGSEWVGQGYGTEALRGFLPYYFDVLGFKVMRLDVAAPNQRAVRCYEKCGFVRTGAQFRPVTSSESDAYFKMPEAAEEMAGMIEKRPGRYYVLFYDMEIRRKHLAESESSAPANETD